MTREESMATALWAIANMKVNDDTNAREALAVCVSIAKIELEKIKRDVLEK